MDPIHTIVMIDGRHVSYRVRWFPAARGLRIRVGISGVELLCPEGRDIREVEAFLLAHSTWVVAQLDRMARLSSTRDMQRLDAGQILFRGEPTQVRVEELRFTRASNRVGWRDGELTVTTGLQARTAPVKSLERWLRQQARADIEGEVANLVPRLKIGPRRIYVMDQRTKWGNCSAKRNLSFNWRLVMAPHYVLRYIVTHEVTHLALPDHSRRFWLTVQSLCPQAERGRQWLSDNANRLLIDLSTLFETSQMAS